MLKLFKDSLMKAKNNIVKIKSIVLPMNIDAKDALRQSLTIRDCQLRMNKENYDKLKRLLSKNRLVLLEDHNYKYLIKNGIIRFETSEDIIEFNNKKVLKNKNNETCIRFNAEKSYVVFLNSDKIEITRIV